MQNALEHEVRKRKVVVDDINFERQKKQQRVGQQLHLLNRKLCELIDQHYQLRKAAATLEIEIQSAYDP
jgi:Breast carcinoma amplified sequence 2 (BCAS2)